METRLLIAYALMLLLALAAGGLLFRGWYNAHSRATARQRLRDKRRYEDTRAIQGSEPDRENI